MFPAWVLCCIVTLWKQLGPQWSEEMPPQESCSLQVLLCFFKIWTKKTIKMRLTSLLQLVTLLQPRCSCCDHVGCACWILGALTQAITSIESFDRDFFSGLIPDRYPRALYSYFRRVAALSSHSYLLELPTCHSVKVSVTWAQVSSWIARPLNCIAVTAMWLRPIRTGCALTLTGRSVCLSGSQGPGQAALPQERCRSLEFQKAGGRLWGLIEPKRTSVAQTPLLRL